MNEEYSNQLHNKFVSIDLNDSFPLPLLEVHKLKFFYVDFREYYSVYGDYIIHVFPFVISLSKITYEDKPLNYEIINMFKRASLRYHHQDYIKGKVSVDPCDIYERVSGIKIHQGESDYHLMNKSYEEEIRLFDAEILSQRREQKLNKLGI
jgi:hypothetical protein